MLKQVTFGYLNPILIIIILISQIGVDRLFSNHNLEEHFLPRKSNSFPYQPGFPRKDSGSTIDFASPSVIDIDNDGNLEVLTADSDGCVYAWNHDGSLREGFPFTTLGDCSHSGRINGPLAIGDIDGDGQMEIAAGTRGSSNSDGQRGKVFVWNNDGSLLEGWPWEMEWNQQYASSQAEVRSVLLADILGDKRLEIVAGTTNNGSFAPDNSVDSRNLYVFSTDGSVLAGFPTWFNRAGIFGFVGAADLICDDHHEIIVGRDHHYVHAYRSDGNQLNQHWPVRTFVDETKTDWDQDLFLEFTHNAPAMGDLDQDGIVEIIIAGKVRDPLKNRQTIRSGILVLEPGGARRVGWKIAQLSDEVLAQSGFYPTQAPALADLDGNGTLEIILTLRDGTLRVYRENGVLSWKYDFSQGKVLYGSEPVIGDIDGDSQLDIIFGTYSPDGTANEFARVIALDAEGNLIPGFPLLLTEEGSGGKQGVRAAPTLTDLDQDGDVELVIASWAGIVYVWDLPGLYQSSLMPWPTGRHDNYRTGFTGDSILEIQQSSQDSDLQLRFTQNLFFPISIDGC